MVESRGQEDLGTHEEDWVSAEDGALLCLRRWFPPGERGNEGVVHLVHGMAEHSLRYDAVARRLCAEGFEVWAADQRGHGKTASLALNSPDRGGLAGHPADRDGFTRVTGDIHLINRRIKEQYPDAPLFLLGHSWGALVVQRCMERYGEAIAGCVLSGTRGPAGAAEALGASALACIAALMGSRRSSRLVRALVEAPFRSPFKPNRTAFDWLSRDKAVVDAYLADPLCGRLCSAGFYRDMAGALLDIHAPDALRQIRRDLPVYVLSGSADPVGGMGAGPTALVNAYRSLGITDLEFVLYPDARHEPLNETNREEVIEDLITWLKKHRASGVH